MNSSDMKPSCIRAAADILGSKWTALIIHELSSGPQRFCAIERAVDDINPRTLTQRLEMLQSHDIITQFDSSYELTDKGRALLPILKDMATWSAHYPPTT